MSTTIRIKNSVVAGKEPAPSDLVSGELALNLVDQKLFTKDQTGNIFDLVPRADQAEVDAGTDASKVVTASTLHAYADATFVPLASWSAIPALP